MNHTKKTIVSITLALLLAASTFLIASADSGINDTAMTSVSVSFSDVLSIISDAYSDLKLLSLSLEDENGVYVYQAELVNPADSSVIEIAIDSQSGQITRQPVDDNSQTRQGDQNGENVQYEDTSDDNSTAEQNGNAEQDGAFDLGTVKVSFSQALSIVSTAYPDRTLFTLQLDSDNGSLVYLAELLNVSDNSVLEVKVDAVSGQMLSKVAGADEQNGETGENENELENETGNDN